MKITGKERLKAAGLFKGKMSKHRMHDLFYEYLDDTQKFFINKVNPVLFVNDLVMNMGKEEAYRIISSCLAGLKDSHNCEFNSKNKIFYKNAYGYLNNKFFDGKKGKINV